MTVTESREDPAALAAHHGLTPSTVRPPAREYLAQLWQRRYFIGTFAKSRAVSKYAGAKLGQVWQLLTPLLNAAVYYLIFGLLLQTSRGITNFIAYLVTGVFVFTFTQKTVSSSARAISGNLSLLRALHFPRACLPLSYTLSELRQLTVSMAALCGIVILTGERPSLWWLTLIPALLLMTVFNIGISLVFARLGAFHSDISQLLPFALRIWLYSSGVIFSIPGRVGELENVPSWLDEVMMANPAAVYIGLARNALMESQPSAEYVATWSVGANWAFAVGWAIVALVIGFWYFWSAEEKYGRG